MPRLAAGGRDMRAAGGGYGLLQGGGAGLCGQGSHMTSWMHEDRVAAVLAVLRDLGARRVLDLGCGDGDLVLRLLREPQIEGVVGLDLSHAALARLRGRLAAAQAGPVGTVIHGSMTAPYPAFAGYDCACLVETIEHLTPAGLPALERAVFGVLRPRAVVLTTPNAEFNDLLNVPRSRSAIATTASNGTGRS